MSLVVEMDVEEIWAGWLKSKNIPFVQDLAATTQRIYMGMENENKTDPQDVPGDDPDAPTENVETSIIRVPCIIVSCQDLTPFSPDFDGNWDAAVRLEICSDAYRTTRSEHKARVESVLELVQDNTLLDQLLQFSPTFYSSKIVQADGGWKTDGDCWTTFRTYIMKLFCGRLIPEE